MILEKHFLINFKTNFTFAVHPMNCGAHHVPVNKNVLPTPFTSILTKVHKTAKEIFTEQTSKGKHKHKRKSFFFFSSLCYSQLIFIS